MRDERLVVYLFDQAEDGNRFGFFGQQDDHFDRLAGITAYAVENGASAVQVVNDPFGYFVVLLREDEELDRLAVTVQHHVEHIITYKHLYKTENDLFDVMKQKKRRTDDEEIAEQQGATNGYILIFVDNSPDDIRTSRTAVCREYKSETGSAKEGSDDDRHKRLVMQDGMVFQQPFEERQGYGQGEDSEYRFYQKFKPKYFQGGQQ